MQLYASLKRLKRKDLTLYLSKGKERNHLAQENRKAKETILEAALPDGKTK